MTLPGEGGGQPPDQAPAPMPFLRLYALLWAFSAGAVAINLFMLGLMAPVLGMPSLTPLQALALALPVSLPVNWWVARWVRRMIDEAEGR